ncbi:MAG: hypothetical protein QNK11_08480 [Legionella sp.]|nr:hypothetical protein [Legionella sp.]
MNTEEIISIRNSYVRCVAQSNFPLAFYDKFICSSPDIEKKFTNVFNIKKRVMVTRGLSSLIKLAEDGQPDEAMQALAEKHNRNNLDIFPEFYSKYKFYMMKTLKEFDHLFDAQLEKLWEEIIDNGIQFFIQNY